jgi:hypothetical protein
MRSNCLIWAIRQWRRAGGYVLMRRSEWYPGPHFLWASADLTDRRAFVPLAPPVWRWWPRLWFRGQIVEGPEAR